MSRKGAGEFARIRAIVSGLSPGVGVVLGAGDDAAVLRPRAGRDLVVTTDAFVEGRHWRREWLRPRAVGRRLAAANLSDLAAMAATPRWAVIACATPAHADPREARAIELACAAALAAEGASVVGGNLTATDGPAWFAVTLIGEVARGRHWTRAGARPGDVLAVTGAPGRAAATLAALAAGRRGAAAARTLLRRYAAPPSRVGVARALAACGGVRAAIDVSDGIAGDLAHLCEASGVGATLDEGAFPADRAFAAAVAALAGDGARARRLAERLRFGPGDDYELLLAVDPKRFEACAAAARAAGATLTSIGRVTRASGRLRLRQPDGAERALPGHGHDHFR